MTSYSQLDPDIAAHLEKVQSAMSSAHLLNASELRKTLDSLRMPPTEVATVNQVLELIIPSPQGEIKARLYRPNDQDNLPLLVWLHGGGWVLGNLDSADLTCRDIASHAECLVLSVDYRLAPEHPFPAAYDDSLSALRYAFENAAMLRANKNRIAIGGDSAGANLAACACMAATDLDVKFQLLIYPVVEPDFSNESYTENADHFGLTRNLMQWFWDQYVPVESNRSDSRVAPLSGDLSDLPPAYLLTVKFDPLRDEGKKLALALKNAGVQVESAQTNNTIHGFFSMPIKAGQQARIDAAGKLKQALL